MMPAGRFNPRIGPISLCVIAALLHAVLREVLARYDVVSCIFAAGPHVPVWMLAITGIFIVTRLFLLLLVPSVLVYCLVIRLCTLVQRFRQVGDTAPYHP